MTKQKIIALTLLLAVSLLLGIAVPVVYSLSQRETQAVGELDPRSTSVPLRTPLIISEEAARGSNGDEPAAEVNTNCTYPMHYWQAHPESWPAEIVIGGIIYTKEDVFLAYLDEEPDIHTQLIQQMYTALLNILHGANPAAIQDTLVLANQWLEDNPVESNLSEFTRREGLYTAQIIGYFNNGEIGPGLCLATANPVAFSQAPTATSSAFTPAPTPTSQQGLSVQVIIVHQESNTQEQVPPPPPQEPPPQPPAVPTLVPTAEPPLPPVPTVVPTVEPTPPALPTAEPPLPEPATPTPAPAEGAEKRHPRGETIADKYGISYEEVMGWNSQGFGFGDIDRAYDLSREKGISADSIFTMLGSGMSWGEIKKQFP
jgi:hypothetical protein